MSRWKLVLASSNSRSPIAVTFFKTIGDVHLKAQVAQTWVLLSQGSGNDVDDVLVFGEVPKDPNLWKFGPDSNGVPLAISEYF